MLNSSTGFAAGELGLIVKTTNSGNNWISTSVPNYFSAKKIIFVNENTGWFMNNNYLYKTTNCGDSWNKQPAISATTYINTLYFINFVFFLKNVLQVEYLNGKMLFFF